jgi:hemerythrin-like domain-containing protein
MTAQEKLCDTHDMVVVHRVFRREFALMPAMLTTVEGGDVQRSAVVGAHAAEVLSTLHHHHSTEDELLWPRLHQRTALPGDELDRMRLQHDRIAGLLDEIGTTLPRWTAEAGVTDRERLGELFGQASIAIDEHLREEETSVLPVVERHITAQEWQELSARGMSSLPPARLSVFLGHILEEATPAERAAFLSKLPEPGRQAFDLVGEPTYRREVAELRRGIRPLSGSSSAG